MRLAIDCGHGYNTSGKRTCPFDDGRQMREHEFNRDVGYILNEKAKKAGDKTVLCFDTVGISDFRLQRRCNIANEFKADIFISIHANAFGDGLNWRNDVGGLVGMFYSRAGYKLAKTVIPELAKTTNMPINSYQAHNYHVLMHTAMPAIITECGFMTNESDAKKLLSYEYREKCAEGIFNGIRKYEQLLKDESSQKNDLPLIIKIDKEKLHTKKVFASVEALSEKYPNFINGMFWNGNRLCDLCVDNEKYEEYKPWPTKPKGSFFIYKNGGCGVTPLQKMETIEGLQMLVQGINLDFTANDSDSLRESMDREGWDLVSDTEVCRRWAIGYDPQADKVKLMCDKADLHSMRDMAIKNGCVKDSKPVAIALDSGGSNSYVKDGHIIFNSDGRYMRNIIYW